MPIPAYIKESATVLDNVIKTTTNPYLLGIGGVVSSLVEVISYIQVLNMANLHMDLLRIRHSMYERGYFDTAPLDSSSTHFRWPQETIARLTAL